MVTHSRQSGRRSGVYSRRNHAEARLGQPNAQRSRRLRGMRHLSLLAACQESGLQSRLAARPYAVLCELAEFIHRFSQRANHERPDALLPQLLSTIGYRDG